MSTNEGTKTGRVVYGAPGTNMYGCLPCPKCKDVHRYPWKGRQGALRGVDVVRCDDCGFQEKAFIEREEG